jgi:hypothetical protein
LSLSSQLRFSFLRFGFVFAGYGGHSIAYEQSGYKLTADSIGYDEISVKADSGIRPL